VARANRGEFILDQPVMKEVLLATIERAKTKHAFSIENFCIMNNHIHFILTPRRGSNLSRIMQWILSVFAVRFNRIYGYKGHVWYDRFKSKVIDDLRKFLAVFHYIDQNPVKARLVSHAQYYAYSGLRHTREGRFHILDPPGGLVKLVFPGYTQLALPRTALAEPTRVGP
jgi:putative transposase